MLWSVTLPETSSSPLKIAGWEMILSFWVSAYFKGRTVSVREGTIAKLQSHHVALSFLRSPSMWRVFNLMPMNRPSWDAKKPSNWFISRKRWFEGMNLLTVFGGFLPSMCFVTGTLVNKFQNVGHLKYHGNLRGPPPLCHVYPRK